jgi:HSP90 family molecular chaperone
MQISTPLSPESLTAVEILESIDENCRNQALEMLRNFVHELRSEQKWEELYSNHPGPMKEMAKQALQDHREGNSRKL